MKKSLLVQKTCLKVLALEIHDLRLTRKKMPNGVVPGLSAKAYEARHRHIAYCLARGKTMDQIEKPREGNQPNKRAVEFYLKEIEDAAKEEQNFNVTGADLETHKAVEQWSNGNESEAVRTGEGRSVADAKDSSILSRCSRALSALFGSMGK